MNITLVLTKKHLVTSSSQCCLIDDPQDREGTIFIPYSLAVQAAQKYSDF